MAKKIVEAKPLVITCPKCQKPIRILEVIFTADFHLQVHGVCDQDMIQVSWEGEVLSCLPDAKGGNGHAKK